MTSKHLDEMKKNLELEKYEKKREKKRMKKAKKKLKFANSGEKLIKTLASETKETIFPDTVVFNSHRSSKKPKIEDKSENSPLLSIDEARKDVFKFGLNALSRKDRVEAKVALAIKLGAIPPKNKCIPLAEYKDKKRKEKAAEEKRAEENESKLLHKSKTGSSKTGSKLGKQANSSKKTKKSQGKDGKLKMGSFDGGMLQLSASEIKKMKSRH